ncbi:DUF6701 domain-containing protein [Photobacterium salinisoli]|uniref:DUF6701 domain-containing protein n=1 Tax=Photobacterium salinisoli TaxID=1616783 RepID=UPI000EA1D7F6|nr:DUF6701 domain-containing protein [Photobacterium salinisoli]
MSKVWRLILLWLLISFQFAWASSEQCSELRTDSRFNVAYQIQNAQLKETIYGAKKNGTRELALWSNDPSIDSIIKDSETVVGGDYYVWLEYEQTGNKQGMLTYYLYEVGTEPVIWRKISTAFADLSSIKSVPIQVEGTSVQEIACTLDEVAPELPEPSNPVCEYFGAPVQSHSSSGRIDIYNNAFIRGNKADFKLGFAAINDGSGLSDHSCTAKGQSWKCQIDPSLIVDPIPMPDSFPEPDPGNGYKSYYDNQVHDIEPGNYGGMEAGSNNTVIRFSSGTYWIKQLTLNGSAVLDVVTGAKVKLYVNRLQINNQALINHNGIPEDFFLAGVGGDASIHITGMASFNGLVYSENNVILDSDFSWNSDLSQIPATIMGAVIAKNVFMSKTSNVSAEGVCEDVIPNDNYELVISPSTAYGLTCERIPVDFTVLKNGIIDTSFVGNLNVSPSSTSNGEVCWAVSENGSCETSSSSIPINGGAVTLYLQSHLVGDVQVAASVLTPGNQLLTANAGPYRFAPYGFRINSGTAKELTAGKPDSLLIEAVASNGAQCEVIEDYGKTGSEAKSLRFTGLDYVRPNSGTRPLLLNGQTVTEAGNVTATLTFTQGRATVPVQYNDAGEISVELADNEWQPEDCPAGATDCDDHQGDWSGLNGTAVLLSRPYTFALCDVTSENGKTDFSGTSGSGPGFAAAGDKFSVTFKPVIWTEDAVMPDQSGDGINDIRTTTSAWCNQLTTPNYYSVSGLVTAPIQLSIPNKPATPSDTGAVAGVLSGAQTYEFIRSLDAENGLVVNNLSWSEVGSLWLQADADYLGMPVAQGVGQLGRFYPAYFSIKESAVSDAYGNFTYMGQPFSLSATVEAKNRQGGLTQNYGYFADDYKESLQLRAVNAGATGSDANNLTSRLSENLSYQHWDKAIQTISTDTLALLRVVSSTNPNVTEPDGPYPVDFGLVVESRHDCATRGCSDFSAKPLSVYEQNGATPETAAALAGDIHARYGRMRLEDAVGREGEKINIPVLLEYWNAGQFVTNGDDHDSVFNGQLYFRQGITNPTTNAITASVGDIKVEEGRSTSGDLYATEGGSREQVRFWQKLVTEPPVAISGENPVTDSGSGTHAGSESQPWLLYNWRDQGDENPSALVTFGIYRGNDRVIYRGERNMNPFIHSN